jgi:hypothetical protein
MCIRQEYHVAPLHGFVFAKPEATPKDPNTKGSKILGCQRKCKNTIPYKVPNVFSSFHLLQQARQSSSCGCRRKSRDSLGNLRAHKPTIPGKSCLPPVRAFVNSFSTSRKTRTAPAKLSASPSRCLALLLLKQHQTPRFLRSAEEVAHYGMSTHHRVAFRARLIPPLPLPATTASPLLGSMADPSPPLPTLN